MAKNVLWMTLSAKNRLKLFSINFKECSVGTSEGHKVAILYSFRWKTANFHDIAPLAYKNRSLYKNTLLCSIVNLSRSSSPEYYFQTVNSGREDGKLSNTTEIKIS